MTTPPAKLKENLTARAFLRNLGQAEAGGVTEVCLFNGKGPSAVGYFDNVEAVAKAIESLDGKGNVYVTLNPVKRDLLARYNNRMVARTYNNPVERTKDTEIHRDSWLVIDIDPKRPSGISATDEERDAALDVTQAVYEWLEEVGVPLGAMILAKSGNGAYILIRLPDYPITKENTAIKKAIINFIADKFDTDKAEIDRTVYNPARLIGAIGTMKMKGENLPERPHRRSELYSIADEEFDPSKDQKVEPFDLYAHMGAMLPKPEEKPKANKEHAQSGDWRQGIDARKIAHLLANYTVGPNGHDHADCPQCGRPQKLWIDRATGAWGCYEPGRDSDDTCDWRKLRDKLKAMARENGIKVEAPKAESKPLPITWMDKVTERKQEWLMPGVPRGEVTIIDGDPKAGKSFITLSWASAVSNGKYERLPGWTERPPGKVLIFSLENTSDTVIKPRLRHLGAMMSNIGVVDVPVTLDEGGILLIEEAVATAKPDLIIVDPITLYIGGKLDIKDANKVRQPMMRLQMLAAKFNCAVVVVRHLNKGDGAKAIYRGLGSIDFIASARSAFCAVTNPQNKDERALHHIATNFKEVEPRGYTIQDTPDEVGILLWTDGPPQFNLESALTNQTKSPDDEADQKDAVSFLREILRDGEQSSADIKIAAKNEGFSPKQLEKARAKAGIEIRYQGQGRNLTTYWRLPDSSFPQLPPNDSSFPHSVGEGESSEVIEDKAFNPNNFPAFPPATTMGKAETERADLGKAENPDSNNSGDEGGQPSPPAGPESVLDDDLQEAQEILKAFDQAGLGNRSYMPMLEKCRLAIDGSVFTSDHLKILRTIASIERANAR